LRERLRRATHNEAARIEAVWPRRACGSVFTRAAPEGRAQEHWTMRDIVHASVDSSEFVGVTCGAVFTTNGKTPISGFSKSKKALNAAMEEIGGKPVKPWKIHDLRRTFSTIMNESPDDGGLGIAPISLKPASIISVVERSLEWLEPISGRKAKVVPIGRVG
jgi:hypothetical protein